VIVQCSYCKTEVEKSTSHVNRAKKVGALLFCSKTCFGSSRRNCKTVIQKKEEKRLYDEEYRKKNAALLKAKKHDYFVKNYDPIKAALERKKKMAQHVEYCRTPEYKEWKKKYDQGYRARKEYGEFWEVFLAVLEIDKEVEERQSKYEISIVNGTFNKAQTRRREYERLNRN